MIESRSQLDDAINYAMFPGGKEYDCGIRGVGFSRANLYGLDFAEHVDAAAGRSRDIVLVAQIEHKNALPELDAIFSHPRLDAYMVGPYDLSASMGCTGDFNNAEFLAGLKSIEQKAQTHGVAKGYHQVAPNPAELAKKISEGYGFLAYGIDAFFLHQAAKRPAIE